MDQDIKISINKNSLKRDSIVKKERVRWFFDGEEYVFTEEEESFLKKVSPRFFIKK